MLKRVSLALLDSAFFGIFLFLIPTLLVVVNGRVLAFLIGSILSLVVIRSRLTGNSLSFDDVGSQFPGLVAFFR